MKNSISISDILNAPPTNAVLFSDALEQLNSSDENVAIKLVTKFAQHDINIDINVTNARRLSGWLAICQKYINRIASCGFDSRLDYNELSILAFCCHIMGAGKASYGANIYNATTGQRLMTIVYNDPNTPDNQVTLYSVNNDDSYLASGTWAGLVKGVIRELNTTGLATSICSSNSSNTSNTTTSRAISSINQSKGNTITVNDLINYIDRIRNIYGKNSNI